MRDCPSLVLGANKILFGHLKFSYEILENQIETKCFLFCCMYCDDLKIDKGRLVEFGLEKVCWM